MALEKKYINFFFLVLIIPVLSFNAIAKQIQAEQQLIIFMQPEYSEVEKSFQDKFLPQIRQMAEDSGIDFSVFNISEKAPSEVALTPLIVYQNHRGRSIYQGRYTTVNRIKNFIRTSRFVPQEDKMLVREDIPVWEYGKSRVWAPVKIAPVTGSVPKDYNHEAFVLEARKAIEKGFKNFKTKNKAELGRADRGFYMDFYPWLSDDRTLFLSLALYSQFHCKEPVFEKKKQPLTGPWKEREKLFARAAEILERAVQESIKEPDAGDGFDPLASDIASVTWESIGLSLPPKPEKSSINVPVNAEIPEKWELETASEQTDNPPVVMFHFQAPLDHYRGEAKKGKGQISFASGKMPETLKGFVEIDPMSVTMGDGSLDSTLQGSIFLDSKKHPFSRFDIKSVSGDGQPLAYGRLSAAVLNGTFTLKGKSIPLTTITEMEPVLSEDGKPRLLVRGSFRINVKEFNIEGADGPAPASENLVFDLNLMFKPL